MNVFACVYRGIVFEKTTTKQEEKKRISLRLFV